MSEKNSPIRILVVGCGNMGKSHALAYHQMDGFEIVGLVSRGDSKKRLNEELGGGYPLYDNYEEAYRLAKALRRLLREQRSAFIEESAIVTRLAGTALELVADLAVVLRAYDALENPDRTLLKAPRLSTHRDPLFGAINAFRTGVVFLFGATIWLVTSSSAAMLMMIMPQS